VAGGHTMMWIAVSSRAPETIAANSAPEARSPFIFQFPATSGRRGSAEFNQ
jgi:hypothetical protein